MKSKGARLSWTSHRPASELEEHKIYKLYYNNEHLATLRARYSDISGCMIGWYWATYHHRLPIKSTLPNLKQDTPFESAKLECENFCREQIGLPLRDKKTGKVARR